MRALLWTLGIALLLIAVAIVALPLLIDEKALVAIAARQVKERTGIELSVDGAASLSLFPRVSLVSTEVRIEVPEQGSRIQARRLATGVALLPLLRGTVEIDSVIVEGLRIERRLDSEAAEAVAADTTTLSNAELDAYYALRRRMRESAGAEAAASALAAPLAFEVGELALTDIRVVGVDDAGEVLSELQLRRLHSRDLNLDGRAMPLSAEIAIPGEAPVSLQLSGAFSADADAASIALKHLEVQISGATREPLTLTVAGAVNLATQVADIELALRSGALEGGGTLRYARFESPQIDAALALTELNPALLMLAGPDSSSAAGAAPDRGDSALPLHALRLIDTRASLTIEQVVLGAHTLRDVDARLRVLDGVASLDPVSAAVHGGQIEFNAVFDGRYNQASLRTAGGLRALDVGRAMQALEAKLAATGTANLAWTLEARGATRDALTRSLAGPVSVTTQAVTLRKLALERLFCQGVALVNRQPLSAEFPADTAFEALGAEIQLTDGIARLDPFTARLSAIDLRGDGALDLNSQNLHANFRAQLAAGLAERDPACRINERYAGLRWPVECRGNLAEDPGSWCRVNVDDVIRDLAENEVKRKIGQEAGKLLKKLFE